MITDQLRCPRCPSKPTTVQEAIAYACAICGTSLELIPRSLATFPALAAEDRGLPWRYPSLLPVGYAPDLDDHVVPRTVRSPLLESDLGVSEAWLVDCTGFGTGTFKDIEAAVVIGAARELGLSRISVHSTGNTALAYRHYARRAAVPCASYIPRQNVEKIGDIASAADYPVFLVDTDFPHVSAVAKAAARENGWHHLAPLAWKLEGKASLAWWLYETCPQIDVIVQTVAGGYGPLGYETGFKRLRGMLDFGHHGVLKNREYLLFQPADADTLTRAWSSGTASVALDDLRLPTDPFEPTLQSTNPVATLPALRSTLPSGSTFHAVSGEDVERAKPWAEKVFAESGITLDYERERSAYISLAGLMTRALNPSTRLALIVTGSRRFHYRENPEAWPVLAP